MLLSLADLSLRGGERYERIYCLEVEPIVLGGRRLSTCSSPTACTSTVDRVAGGFLVNVVARRQGLRAVRALPG